MRRPVERTPTYEPAGVEEAGLPRGVRLRWYRLRGARALLVDPPVGAPVPPGAVVWSNAPEEALAGAFEGAAAVVAGAAREPGPEALPEPEAVAEVPGVREAVAAALADVPERWRAGAAEHAERALAELGL